MCNIRCTIYQLLIKNNIQCNIFILIAVVYIYIHSSSINCKQQVSAINLPKSSPTTKKLDSVADKSRKMTYSVTRSPARRCLCSRDGKVCYYGRLEYDLLAFFVSCFLLPYPGMFTVSSSCSFVCTAVISFYILSPSTLTWRQQQQQPIMYAPRYVHTVTNCSYIVWTTTRRTKNHEQRKKMLLMVNST